MGITSIVGGDIDINTFLGLQVKSSPKDCDFIPPEFILKAAGRVNET